jgi:hypothetical protein
MDVWEGRSEITTELGPDESDWKWVCGVLRAEGVVHHNQLTDGGRSGTWIIERLEMKTRTRLT